jgi:SAM-dependent methyltransferase
MRNRGQLDKGNSGTVTISSVRSKVLLDYPSAALVTRPRGIRETVYGIVKRLDFFVQHIEAYRQRESLEPHQVRVLDVGCGTGVNVTIPLANAGYSVVGLDFDAASIDRARELAQGLNNVEFICDSLESLQSQQFFHVAICSEVLEHFQDPVVFVRKLAGALKERGLLLVTVPNGFGFFELDSVFWRILSRYPRLVNNLLYGWENRFWKVFGSSDILRRRKEEYTPDRLKSTRSTLAPDLTHYQSFTRSKITQLLQSQGCCVSEVRNNTFLAGNLLGLVVRELDRFLAWNARIADKLPGFLVSGWLIAAQKSTVIEERAPLRNWDAS